MSGDGAHVHNSGTLEVASHTHDSGTLTVASHAHSVPTLSVPALAAGTLAVGVSGANNQAFMAFPVIIKT